MHNTFQIMGYNKHSFASYDEKRLFGVILNKKTLWHNYALKFMTYGYSWGILSLPSFNLTYNGRDYKLPYKYEDFLHKTFGRYATISYSSEPFKDVVFGNQLRKNFFYDCPLVRLHPSIKQTDISKLSSFMGYIDFLDA